jgi:hypothetical protein
MRRGLVLAMAMGLSFLTPATALCQQTSADSVTGTGQPPPTPAQPPPARKITRQSAAKAGAAPPSPTKTRQQPAPVAPRSPRKIVVRKGGAREPAEQIVPGISPAEAARQRQNAEGWLSATDVQLKQLAPRKLSPQQQETADQVRNYINGAHAALQEGDVRRASTLAEKAHLLSDDLLNH